jgi:NADP-dependent 3-hydroxy acid dehydrogenase YdfG
MTALVWFITGCSSGFGANLAVTALKAGHKVIATSRSISTNPEAVAEVKSLGGDWLEFDVCSPKLGDGIEKALGIHGHIDVLVNNAGISVIGAVEDMT